MEVPMNSAPSTRRIARLAVAAVAAGTAYGITATAIDFTPTQDEENAATAIEYGLIAAYSHRGVTAFPVD
jgi:hypothetical protein